MPTTPRTHHRAPDQRIPAPAAAVGDQDLDDYVDDPAEPYLEDANARRIDEADLASSTADGADLGRETGELYGQGIAPTGDVDEDGVRTIQDYDGQGTDEGGEHFFEALVESATENGPAGEAPIDDTRGTDADERGARRRDRDVPVADRGSGGPAGL